MNMTDFPSFFEMIRTVGGLIGGDYARGVALLVLLAAGLRRACRPGLVSRHAFLLPAAAA